MDDPQPDGISEKDQGIPTTPQPDAETAKGTPNDDRLQSEVPQQGNKPE